MENILQLARQRRSVRTFNGQRLSGTDLEKLKACMAEAENPYGIPVGFRLLDAREQPLKCPVVTGTEQFLGAKIRLVPHAEEAFGYSLEQVVLCAQSLGIGTVWVGGTMDRAAFEKAMGLTAEERMLCMFPIGYPAEKMAVREIMMRKGVKADNRLSFGEVFFDGSFDKALTPEKAGVLAEVLEAVRLAPSAVNKQPWRVVVTDTAAHFYKKTSKGFVSQTNGDMQKIDMGIALAHFALAAAERGLPLRFELADPQLPTEAGTEYIATYCFA